MKYIILIPAYKPNQELLTLLKTIPQTCDIVLIDDGSGKEYQHIFLESKKYAHVISYVVNKGKGHALKTGLKYIKDTYKSYIVVTMDCDGQHKVTDALKLCHYIDAFPGSLALGKRKWNSHTPLRSRIGNSITRKVYYYFTKLKIYDTQTGLRAFSYKLIDYMLAIKGDRFEYEMNVLLNLKKNNIEYTEIPIETIYINKNKHSHFKAMRDAYKIYKAIFKWHKENKN